MFYTHSDTLVHSIALSVETRNHSLLQPPEPPSYFPKLLVALGPGQLSPL